MTATISLVERKKFDDKQVHAIAPNIWWVGFKDTHDPDSHNPYLLVDGHESVLINPGSRAERQYRIIHDKVASLVDPASIEHIVLLHDDPERCASLPLFESIANRNVKIYAPSRIAASIKYYGCKHPVIALDGGDSIILKSGRTLNFYETPQLESTGSGMIYDESTGTLFTGNMFRHYSETWDLYAPANGWESISPYRPGCLGSQKAYHHTLNKIERLSPQRLCPHRGSIIEENIEKFIQAARKMPFNE